jgi:hypothetical protein
MTPARKAIEQRFFSKVAMEYGLNPSNVSLIKSGKRWGRLTGVGK